MIDYTQIHNYKSLIKYRQIDKKIFLTYLIVDNGNIKIEKYEDDKLVETYNLGKIDKLD